MKILQGLKSELEKTSTSLERTAIFSKESRISELPRQGTFYFLTNYKFSCSENNSHSFLGT